MFINIWSPVKIIHQAYSFKKIFFLKNSLYGGSLYGLVFILTGEYVVWW